MFTKTTAATTTKTATTKTSTTRRSIRALALAGVMAIAASACSVGETTEVTKATSTTITQSENIQNESTEDENNDENDNDENDNDENNNEDSNDEDTADHADDEDRTAAPENDPADNPVTPRPAPQPEPEPAYIVGACGVVDYPALDTYVAYADAELRTEPVVGTPIEIIFAGDIAYPYFTEFDCALGDDGTVWWFIGTEFGTEAWVNAAWLDPVDLNEAIDYTAAAFYYVAVDCLELRVDAACDELFSRNDGSASAIGSAFVNAYMAGDVATLDNLSTAELTGSWAGLLPTEDIAGDGFGAESLSISGNTISFTPFPTGGISCYADAGEIAFCSFAE